MKTVPYCLALCCVLAVHAEDAWRFTQGDWTVEFGADGDVVTLENANGDAPPGFVTEPVSLEVVAEAGEPRVASHAPLSVESIEHGVRITYAVDAAIPVTLAVERILVSAGGWPVLRSTVTVTPTAAPLEAALAVSLGHRTQADHSEVFVPRQDGLGETLQNPSKTWVWAMARNPEGVAPDQRLAIPMISESAADGAWRITTIADPWATVSFAAAREEHPPYPASKGEEEPSTRRQAGLGLWGLRVEADLGVLVAEGPVTRTFWTVFHPGDAQEAMAAWYATALADVPEGPDWLHDVAWQHYDYMSHGGQGWFEDLDAIEKYVEPQDRNKIVFALHGWYDLLGRYTFDAATGKLDDTWTAFPNAAAMKGKGFLTSEPVEMSKAELHRRIKYAKDRGVRVALYFADGLTACEGAGRFAEDRLLFWGGWNGPDTIGKAYCQDPVNPDVYRWYVDYLQALLDEYGNELDAYVWDETFMVRAGAVSPRKVYAAPAMMRLVKELTQTTTSFRTELAFLTSDCIGGTTDDVNRWLDVPPYAIMAHGTYQDSHSRPSVWPYGIFPNYRNVLWSCNWKAIENLPWTAFGVEHYDTPVATSNGWLDDKGLARLSDAERQAVLDLFEQRKTRRQELRWLTGLAPAFQ